MVSHLLQTLSIGAADDSSALLHSGIFFGYKKANDMPWRPPSSPPKPAPPPPYRGGGGLRGSRGQEGERTDAAVLMCLHHLLCSGYWCFLEGPLAVVGTNGSDPLHALPPKPSGVRWTCYTHQNSGPAARWLVALIMTVF